MHSTLRIHACTHVCNYCECSIYHSLTSCRCLSYNINCIEANRMFVLNLLAREGKCEDAAGSLSDLVQLLDLFEPRNHSLYYDMSLAFARLVRPYVFFLIHLYLPCVCVCFYVHTQSGENPLVLQQTITLVERAISLAPLDPTYIIEVCSPICCNTLA